MRFIFSTRFSGLAPDLGTQTHDFKLIGIVLAISDSTSLSLLLLLVLWLKLSSSVVLANEELSSALPNKSDLKFIAFL